MRQSMHRSIKCAACVSVREEKRKIEFSYVALCHIMSCKFRGNFLGSLLVSRDQFLGEFTNQPEQQVLVPDECVDVSRGYIDSRV
jgi:hypothetical protein